MIGVVDVAPRGGHNSAGSNRLPSPRPEYGSEDVLREVKETSPDDENRMTYSCDTAERLISVSDTRGRIASHTCTR
jgi:YD repeat-containing protein